MTEVSSSNDYINSLAFVDEQERMHFAKAQLGEQVRDFLASPAGRYLHGRAKQLLDECQANALDCNADSFFGRRKLKRYQRDAEVAKMFMSWCAEAIVEGEMSFRELQNY
jgi:hypothetical protein